MRQFTIDPLQDIPTIDATIRGRLGSTKIKIAFDTGAARTQIHTPLIEALGYSVSNALRWVSVAGPFGPPQQGYFFKIKSIEFLGMQFKDMEITALDFDNFSEEGIEGLLGWDLIKQIHLEMDGPARVLRVFEI